METIKIITNIMILACLCVIVLITIIHSYGWLTQPKLRRRNSMILRLLWIPVFLMLGFASMITRYPERLSLYDQYIGSLDTLNNLSDNKVVDSISTMLKDKGCVCFKNLRGMEIYPWAMFFNITENYKSDIRILPMLSDENPGFADRRLMAVTHSDESGILITLKDSGLNHWLIRGLIMFHEGCHARYSKLDTENSEFIAYENMRNLLYDIYGEDFKKSAIELRYNVFWGKYKNIKEAADDFISHSPFSKYGLTEWEKSSLTGWSIYFGESYRIDYPGPYAIPYADTKKEKINWLNENGFVLK